MNTRFVDKITNFLFLFGLFVSCIAIILSSALLMKKSGETKSKNSCYIVTSEKYVLIDFSKSKCAEFGVVLGDSPVSDYADGFSFSYRDLDRNALDDSPVKVTGVKAEKKNGWCTATVSVSDQTPPGMYYIRVSHKLARFSTDVPVIVIRRVEEE